MMAESTSRDDEQYLPEGYQRIDEEPGRYHQADWAPDVDQSAGPAQYDGYEQNWDQQDGYSETDAADFWGESDGYEQEGWDDDGYALDDEAPAVWHEPHEYENEGEESYGRRDRRRAQVRRRAQKREARWQHNRLAVPYRTDGPRITSGVLWFGVVLGLTIWDAPLLLAIVLALLAGTAALQTGYAWCPDTPPTKWATACAAFIIGVSGYFSPSGIGIGVVVGIVILVVYAMVSPDHREPVGQLLDVLTRSSIPVGLAVASMVGLANIEMGAILALVLLVSAYEVGDFLIGSGSANAIEGPITGLTALGAVLFLLWVVAPAPFTDRSMLLFGALAAVCCPLGQILGSALLPRGNAWAPALRRLDSYLIAAPLWLLLLESSPTASSL